MLDVGPSSAATRDEENADLAVFVDRIAAAGADRPTAAAKAAIRRAIAVGHAPPGLRKLAEGLAASVGPQAPLPRHPAEDASSIVSAVRGDALVVLDGFDATALADSVAALVADGRRVVVTSATAAALAAVRDELPGHAYARSVDRLPELPPDELRELRRLLATSTLGRRSRLGQVVPPASALPSVSEVATLCARAQNAPGSADDGMVSALLAELEHERRMAVVSVATCVNTSLSALLPRRRWEWAWSLLGDLVRGQDRAPFDRMLEDTAQAVAALERSRGAATAEIIGPLPADAVDLLHGFREFLSSGGRARSYFRSPAQRDVQPVLRLVRIDGRVPETVEEVSRAIEHLELGRRLAQVDAGCAELALSPPRGENDLVELADGLVRVAAGVRSVSALKHDVLFIADNSPISVPDVDSAHRLAHAVLHYAEHGSAAEAATAIERAADAIDAHAAPTERSGEHQRAVAALRARNVAGYAAELDGLGAARREAADAARERQLLVALAEHTPMLADAWQRRERGDAVGIGFAAFLPIDTLLGSLPPTDSADVVIVMGAAGLGVERLLLGAVAPRMVAVVAPDDAPDVSPNLLSVLERASALVIRGRSETAGRLVRLDADRLAGGHPVSVPGQAKAGA